MNLSPFSLRSKVLEVVMGYTGALRRRETDISRLLPREIFFLALLI